jgi:hypothetical protein
MTINDDATTPDGPALGAHLNASLHLSGTTPAGVEDHETFGVLHLGGLDVGVAVFARSADTARDVADTASVWAELTEARERGEDVELWGGWVLPADTFRGPR